MINFLKRLLARKSRKAKVVVPPVWPYKQSKIKKLKMKGTWETK